MTDTILKLDHLCNWIEVPVEPKGFSTQLVMLYADHYDEIDKADPNQKWKQLRPYIYDVPIIQDCVKFAEQFEDDF